jgi:hypothetical protein
MFEIAKHLGDGPLMGVVADGFERQGLFGHPHEAASLRLKPRADHLA